VDCRGMGRPNTADAESVEDNKGTVEGRQSDLDGRCNYCFAVQF